MFMEERQKNIIRKVNQTRGGLVYELPIHFMFPTLLFPINHMYSMNKVYVLLLCQTAVFFNLLCLWKNDRKILFGK